MLARADHVARVRTLLADFPVVAILGARQVGKTTLAGMVSRTVKTSVRFDLEDAGHLERLADPMLSLGALRGLVVLDEVQRRPAIFEALRVLADRPRTPARFLVLGSASPDLLRQSSETLAGRIAYHSLGGLNLSEVGMRRIGRLWTRGGFPKSFLARTERASLQWREQLVQTFLERDAPALGLRLPPVTMRRFWTMLAHWHGQRWNSSELARAFGVADTTVRAWLDFLTGALVVRQLAPWFENVAKRQVRAPKVYVADSGVLHALLSIPDTAALEAHPKIGASWEGFIVDQLATRLGARPHECFYWATHGGAELDLLVVRGVTRRGFEIKRTTAPSVTSSMRTALADLRLEQIDVIHAGSETYHLAKGVRAVAASRLLEDVAPLSAGAA